MINVKDYPEIIHFLKSYSVVYRETSTEIIIHCPYCDDALRKNAKSHGHLYISTRNPVFHCFRCNMSGIVGNLLVDLGFNNLNLLSLFKKNYFSIKNEKFILTNKTDIHISKKLQDICKKFSTGDQNNYKKFENFLFQRIGSFCDFNKYLVIPDYKQNQLCASFYNFYGSYVTSRVLETSKKIRYYREKNISEKYFFQDPDFDLYTDIVLTEGIFDSIKLYRFSDIFPKYTTFFLAILGKNYGKVIESLIENHIPFGNHTISLVFDNDNKFFKRILFSCRKMTSRVNSRIRIRGFIPTISNDAGEYPFLREII